MYMMYQIDFGRVVGDCIVGGVNSEWIGDGVIVLHGLTLITTLAFWVGWGWTCEKDEEGDKGVECMIGGAAFAESWQNWQDKPCLHFPSFHH